MPPNGYYSPAPQPDYSFLTDSTPAPRRQVPGGGSLLSRVIIVGVGLLILLIIFNVVKGFLAGPQPWPYFVTTAEDQEEIVHLATGATDKQDLSTSNRNSVLTAQLTMKTHLNQTLQYLSTNHKKVNNKTLALKLDGAVDTQLSGAENSGNFNPALHDAMKSKLQSYQRDLQVAFAHTKGPKGKQLLTQEYNDAGLLLQQLDSPLND